MADFEVRVERVTIEPHPQADRIELAVVGDYRSIVKKGEFAPGDLAAYIPEASVVPDDLLAEMDLTGKLSGSRKNRVKAIKLRGVLSQGLCYPARDHWRAGDNVAAELGIVKYEPPIPTHMAGRLSQPVDDPVTLKFDVENIKKHPGILQEGEEVALTEKIHGTFCELGWHPAEGFWVTSKGYAKSGLFFQDTPANDRNVYVKCLRQYRESLDIIRRHYPDEPLYVLGEIYGRGIQDLTYGCRQARFAAFDVFVGSLATGSFLERERMRRICGLAGIPVVPELYAGPFSRAVLAEYTRGRTAVGEDVPQIREGLVIRPVPERTHPVLGRVILKSVSEDYLLRKGGTELE